MLRIYRRHKKNCSHRSERYRRCQCPVWVSGVCRGRYCRMTLRTNDWEQALQMARAMESPAQDSNGNNPVVVQEAIDNFISDCQARNLASESVRKNHNLLSKLALFCQGKGIEHLQGFTPDLAREFRAGWVEAPITAAKNLERLKHFFRFAVSMQWMKENPAASLKPPRNLGLPTLPFTQNEFKAILAACSRYDNPKNRATSEDSSRMIEAFVLLLRYSGLRIGDALRVGPGKLSGNKLLLYQQKTGVPVFVPLPEFVTRALHAFEPRSPTYFFWSGQGSLKTRRSNLTRSLSRLMVLAAVPNGHAHRFRDTFAVELLQQNVSLEMVSILLGHSTIRITEKHYSPWVQARQQAMEAAVARVWRASGPPARRRLKGSARLSSGPAVREKKARLLLPGIER